MGACLRRRVAERDRVPDHVLADGETLEIDGLRIRTHELGPCESASEALFVIEAPGATPVAFTGDLFYVG